jgi:hypothetical protein
MTAPRALILLVVVVGILYAVSLVISNRNNGQTADPKAPWLNGIPSSKAIDLSEVSATNGWQNGNWTIPAGVTEAALNIADVSARKFQLPIRKVKLSFSGSASFEVVFRPLMDKSKPATYADPQAMALTNQFKPGQAALNLSILEHGGALVARRTSGTGPAIFKLQ